MELDAGDLKTETFTNSQGWTLVKVTHVPTSISVERSRESDRQSPVQAHSECVAEVKQLLAQREGDDESAPDPSAPVTREEFEALVARVAELETRAAMQAAKGRSGSGSGTGRAPTSTP